MGGSTWAALAQPGLTDNIASMKPASPCRLADEGSDAPRLGWMGWLKTDEFATDAGDSVSEWVN